MRAEVERAYQAGGLAAATGGGEEEESTPAITAQQLVERATNPAAGQTLTQMIIGNKDQAMERLRAGREEIASRREARSKSQDRDRWLAMAQGMLAPTRTGGFGESLGQTAGLMREESAQRQASEAEYDEQLNDLAAQEIAAEAEAVDRMLELSGQADAATGIHGAIKTMVHNDDRDLPVADQRVVFGSLQEQPNGDWELIQLEDEDGRAIEAADRLDPARAAALVAAAERAERATGRSEDMITSAYGAKDPLMNIRRANDILEDADNIIETSGFQALKNRVANWTGLDFGDTTELTELHMIVAQDYLDKLTALKGNTSDRDVVEMRGISVGIGLNTTTNYRQLRKMEAVYHTSVVRGIREAYESGNMNAVADLWESAETHKYEEDAVFIEGQEDFDKLDPGTYYYVVGQWGGVLRQKPTEEEEAAAAATAEIAAGEG